MDAIRYLDADTILDYLHNSSETYLEGLIPQSYGFPTETDRSVYVRLLKVPVRDKASEVYMQAIPYKMFEGDSNRPIEEFGKDTKFEKVGVVIDSSRLWLMEPLWRICTQSRQKFDEADFVSEFWDAFTRKVLKEYAVDAGVEKSEAVKNLAKQYAILNMLSKREKPVYFGCIENALQTLYPVSVLGYYELGLNYACDPEGFTTSLLTSLSRRNFKTTSKETPTGAYIPKKVAAARMADKMSPAFVFDDNESQRIAKSVSVYCARTLDARKNITIVIGNGNGEGITVKISCSSFFFYEPTTKEVFINVESADEEEREKINQYVKDNSTSVSENLVPLKFLQSIISYGCEKWNPNYI